MKIVTLYCESETKLGGDSVNICLLKCASPTVLHLRGHHASQTKCVTCFHIMFVTDCHILMYHIWVWCSSLYVWRAYFWSYVTSRSRNVECDVFTNIKLRLVTQLDILCVTWEDFLLYFIKCHYGRLSVSKDVSWDIYVLDMMSFSLHMA